MSKYVPQNVHLVCSNGMTKSDLIVSNREAKIVNGNLWATIEDKPRSFGCKWLGIIVAALTALILVATAATGGLAAIAIGAAIGAAAATGMGFSSIPWCYLATMNAKWELHHQTVKLGGEKMLLDTSTLTCSIGFGGKVFIFYSEAAANRQRNAFATRNLVEIIGAAGMGAFIGSGLAIYSTSGLLSTQMGVYLGFASLNYVAASEVDGFLDAKRDDVASAIVPYSENVSESEMTIKKNEDNDAFEKSTFYLDDPPSLISDPILENYNQQQGIGDKDYRPSRAEVRREYNKKTDVVRNKNGSLERPKNKPKSLNHDSKSNPANSQKNKATARGRGFRRNHAGRKIMHGVRDFAILTGIIWAADVVSVSLQRHADNNLSEEEKAKALVNVQAQNF